MKLSLKSKMTLLTMFKLSIGVMIAIGISQEIGLVNIYSSGTIALITLLTSKWESLRISLWRIASYFVTVALTFFIESFIHIPILCFGIVVALLYAFCEWFNILPVLAVNGVICSHFVASQNFSFGMVLNEFLIVLIGALTAIAMNQIYTKKSVRYELRRRMKAAEYELSALLLQMADQLENGIRPLPDLEPLEKSLSDDWQLARDFDENSYADYADYYKAYYSMRLKQVQVLQNLEWEMEHLSSTPSQAAIIAEYIRYLQKYIRETHFPVAQEKQLQHLLGRLKKDKLPESRKEFEDRAILYHVLMTLEEFIQLKQSFIESLTEVQKKSYWAQNMPEHGSQIPDKK